MRRLSFGTEQQDRDRFDILYGGLCVSPAGVGKADLKNFVSLIEKFESVGKPAEGSVVKFQLGDEGGDILLEESEFSLLKSMHEPIRWVGPESPRKAASTYAWLEAIPETKLEAVK